MPPQLAQALRLQQAGDLAGAEGLYRQVLLQRPGQPDALHLLGLVQHQKGDSAAAVPLIEEALAGKPDAVVYRRNLASILAGLGNSSGSRVNQAQAMSASVATTMTAATPT